MTSLSEADIRALRRQRALSDAAVPCTYAYLALAGRWRYGYRFRGLGEFRREVWRLIDSHPGPVILAANHLTLVDSFLIFWAAFPIWRVFERRRLPWSTPEHTNYYRVGGPLKRRVVRAFLYLCRCIPFLRGGDDPVSVAWREKAFEKCVWVLEEGGTIFVFPEATRSRSGWFDASRPKEFLARLAQRVPDAMILCVYVRGEGQFGATAYPASGETFRMHVSALKPPHEGSSRALAERLFGVLGSLQDRWFSDAGLARHCSGNDIVDLSRADGGVEEEPDPEAVERVLTPREAATLAAQAPEERRRCYWRFMAAKEACSKALGQAGLRLPDAGFALIEADLFRRRALYLPSGLEVSFRFTDDDDDKIHCIAVLRGGSVGDADESGDVSWRVEALPEGADPSDAAREGCLRLIQESSDDIPSPAVLAFTEIGGVPKVLWRGAVQDWGVSLSHSGRWVAYSFMTS